MLPLNTINFFNLLTGDISMSNTTKPDQKVIVATEPSKAVNQVSTSIKAEQKKPAVEVKKSDVPEKLTVPADDNSKVAGIEKKTVEKPAAVVVTKPESPEFEKPKTKAEKAKVIYDQMIDDEKNDRPAIIAKIKKELGLTKAGAQTYFYKFQKESGRITEKLPTKMDKAKEVFDKMTDEKHTRKEIIDAFIKEVGLTKAGASTYFQNLKNVADKPVKA
jgi:hypothetical protein